MKRKYDKAISDGDLDGFAATALLHEAFGLMSADFPPPYKRRGLVIAKAFAVELPPSYGLSLVDAVLIDHHQFKGVFYFSGAEGAEPEAILETGDVPSVVRVVEEYTGVALPKEIGRRIDLVDSKPGEVMNEAWYIGYRLLIREPKWREFWADGIEGVVNAFKLFDKVGSEFVGRKKEFEGNVEVIEKPYAVYVVVKPKVLEVEGMKYDPVSYIGQERLLELEKMYEGKKKVAVKVTDFGNQWGLTIASISEGVDASVVARAVAEALKGTGGGRAKVAGAQVSKSVSLEHVIDTVEEILKGK